MKPTEIILDNNTKPIYQEIHIEAPDGYEIDRESSTFECIKFKPINKPKFGDYDGSFEIVGFFIDSYNSTIKEITKDYKYCNFESTRGVFAAEKQAKSARAMAQISQIIANDERFGGVITDEEWEDTNIYKFVLTRSVNKIQLYIVQLGHNFLAFHTEAQGKLFLKENEQLVKDYLMMD